MKNLQYERSKRIGIEAAMAAKSTKITPIEEDVIATSLRLPKATHDALAEIVYNERKRGNRISIHSLILKGAAKVIAETICEIRSGTTPEGVFPKGRWSLSMDERPDLWTRLVNESPRAMEITPAALITVPEFCRIARISIRSFHLWRNQGLGPRVTKLGRRTLITKDSMNKWLKDQQETVPGDTLPRLVKHDRRRKG